MLWNCVLELGFCGRAEGGLASDNFAEWLVLPRFAGEGDGNDRAASADVSRMGSRQCNGALIGNARPPPQIVMIG